MDSEVSDILIVGGGVVGLTTALFLAEQGTSVSVVDRQAVGREASWAGAGMLPPGKSATATTPEARLRSYSHQLWAQLSESLRQRTGIDNGYRVCGALEVFRSEDRDEYLAQLTAWRAEGLRVISSDATDDSLRSESAKSAAWERHVPGLGDQFCYAAYLPEFAQVRNPRHLKALVAACRAAGVEIVEHADDLALQAADDGRVRAATATRRFDCDRICVTAGAWTPRLLEPLGFSLPIVPVRGQMVQLRVEQLPFTCVIEQGRRYLVPRPDGLILVGSTEERAGFVKQNTNEGVSGLLRFAESVVPELRHAELVRSWAGLRPGSPDELPCLGAVPGLDNLYVGAGHFRSGLQMSAGTGKILADLLLNRTADIDLAGLSCERLLTTRDHSHPTWSGNG